MTTYLGKICSFELPRVPLVKLPSIHVFSYFHFGFEGLMWDLIVSVPDHFYLFRIKIFRTLKFSGKMVNLFPRYFSLENCPFKYILMHIFLFLLTNYFIFMLTNTTSLVLTISKNTFCHSVYNLQIISENPFSEVKFNT